MKNKNYKHSAIDFNPKSCSIFSDQIRLWWGKRKIENINTVYGNIKLREILQTFIIKMIILCDTKFYYLCIKCIN